MEAEATPQFREWAVLELFGHRRLAGLVSEQNVAGAGFLRLDIPATDPADGRRDGFKATQFYSPSAIYSITPTSEAVARAMAEQVRYQPVTVWELPLALREREPEGELNGRTLYADGDDPDGMDAAAEEEEAAWADEQVAAAPPAATPSQEDIPF